MYEGVRRSGLEFFADLKRSKDFCETLGCSVLAAGRLEGSIIRYLNECTSGKPIKSESLGRLIGILRDRDEDPKVIRALEETNRQRIDFVHNVHNILSGLTEEPTLPSENLIDTDVLAYKGYAMQLEENLNDMAAIYESRTRIHT